MELGASKFVPRLGGEIIGICSHPKDPSRYAVTTSDNSVRVVKP